MRMLVPLAVSFLVTSAAVAQVNRCVSPEGKVTFTEGLCPAGTQGGNRASVPPPPPAPAQGGQQPWVVRPVPLTPQEEAREAARQRSEARAAEREQRQKRAEQQRAESADLRMQRERMETERQRVELERERTELRQQQVRNARENEVPAGHGANIPNQSGPNSHACDVAKRNLGVGANRESKERSQREYEVACFGSGAANVEAARQGAPRTTINVNVSR